jgi:hypothetical protein
LFKKIKPRSGLSRTEALLCFAEDKFRVFPAMAKESAALELFRKGTCQGESAARIVRV